MKGYTYLKLDSSCCCIYTDSVWYAEGEISINTLSKEFESTYGIKLDCLPFNMVSDTKQEFKKFLKKRGFKELSKMKSILISD